MRKMTLARLVNFVAFCCVVVAMLVVELVLWNHGRIDQAERARLHFVGFGFVAAMIVVEMVFELADGRVGGGGRESRGFPVVRRDKP